MRRFKFNSQKKRVNKRLLVLVLLLTGFGLVALADSSAPQALRGFGDNYYFVKQQGIWAIVGIITLVVVSQVHYSFWKKIATPLFLFSVLLLVLVLIPGLGIRALGARRWLIVGPIQIQPSELIKLSLAVYFAKLINKEKELVAYLIPLAVVSVLIMLQPDLGTMIVVASIGLSQIFISGVNLLYFGGILLVGGLASLLLVIFSDYRRARLLTFFEATSDPLGKSYHIRQVLLALGLGGVFGVGLGQSRQKFLFLPEAATDSIFAIVAEEVGFVGATLLIITYAFFVLTAIRVALRAPDRFSKALAVGLTVWIGGQAILNIGSMVALVPLTGIPLPFFSYGGSSLTMTLLATGILLNISKYEKEAVARKKRK